MPAASVRRTHYTRRMYGFEPSLPPFHLHEMPLELRPDADHNVSMGFRVTKKNAEIKDPIVIRELEFEAV